MSETRGRLTMAATHLGNPGDIPPRSLAALRDAELLIFEEDRPARTVLKAAGLTRDYRRYSEHQEQETLSACRAALARGGWVTYMSDQGTPCLADPGRDLLDIAYELGAKVDVVPGPSALTAAIAACPFDCRRFFFAGFPPRDAEARRAWLREILALGVPVAMMDTPYRLAHLVTAVGDAIQAIGRRAFLALDISGPLERFVVGDKAALTAAVPPTEVNFVMIIDGNREESRQANDRRSGRRRGGR